MVRGMVVVIDTEALKRLRVRADISPLELAEELGISKRALQYFEAGERPMPRYRDQDDYRLGVEAIKARRAEAKAS